jgi:hypothetical protein
VLCELQAEDEETVAYRAYMIQPNGTTRIDNANTWNKYGTEERGVDVASILWLPVV